MKEKFKLKGKKMISENVKKEIESFQASNDAGFDYDLLCDFVHSSYAVSEEDDNENSVMTFEFSDDSCLVISFYDESVTVYGSRF